MNNRPLYFYIKSNKISVKPKPSLKRILTKLSEERTMLEAGFNENQAREWA